MDDDSRVIDKGWDALPDYRNKSGDADDAVTVSISTTQGEWLVNTVDAVVVPMSMAEVVDALQRRKLTERSLVWRAGMQEWAPVDKVPQLKLAARMAPTAPASTAPIASVPPPASTTAPRPTNSTKPPPKPVRSTTPPPPSASSHSAPLHGGPASLPSRKATLPFGLATPPAAAHASRPNNVRPSSPRHPIPAEPPARAEEPEVLAVYARPTATISFDLSPEQPLRAEPPAPPPQTLAPTTTDSAPRRLPPPRNADLSVVAASQFRQVQRSSKRLVWISSFGSAAAASLLTFWLARGPQTTFAQSAVQPVDAVAPAAAAAPVAAPVPVAPSVPSAAPATETSPSAEPATPVAEAARPKAKPASHKPRAVRVAPTPRAVPNDGDTTAASKQPSAEPNPYDVKLDEEAPTPKATPELTRSSGLEADSKGSEAKAVTGAATPGF
jgi:hypothetical protein